jgi:hypothetical protein
VVADARAEITRLMQLGELQNDPIRHPIQELSVRLDALYRVTRASSQMLTEQIQASAQQIPTGSPLRDEDLGRAVMQGIARYTTGAERTLSVRAGLLLAAMLAGAGAGYWFGQSTEATRFAAHRPGVSPASRRPRQTAIHRSDDRPDILTGAGVGSLAAIAKSRFPSGSRSKIALLGSRRN